MPKAAGLAAAIKETFGTDAELIKGGNGIFDVKVDGDLIFSKYKVNRFPEHDEILEMLRG
ncbi:MAG: Rdx family protein [Deltaproteobacteria bacterium]|nr:Rdx family protein [Deltaproteobacteria bacterium]